ncbi:MAG: alpha-galactosidase [Christensenellaceae bacterium]|jgi:alpha-galactosidase|nr:alpha-galactosidase [Christensenellaceae bacterium]
MLDNGSLVIQYHSSGSNDMHVVTGSNIDFDIIKSYNDNILKFDFKSKTDKNIIIDNIEYCVDYKFKKGEAFFGNGYQSWTDTREYKKGDKIRDLGFVGKHTMFKKIFMNAGDYGFASYSNRRSLYHGISYAYTREGCLINLIGSLNERSGYTVIYADMRHNKIKISKELPTSGISGEYNLFSLYDISGDYDEVFDKYFSIMGVKTRTSEKLKGYTSWYNYYSNISEEIVLRDLESLSVNAESINAFQIDDGYQTAVGDWLSVDAKKFPNGMKHIADAIHQKGLKAGIWLAPLAAETTSKIFNEKPEWFITDSTNKPVIIGPNWSKFYGLNFYIPEVREHIKHFFDVVLNEWGYDLVKLDFLYAASAFSMYGKSRAECMYDGMEFIRECVGDKAILACGVPIFPCFNLVEYMRIGADMGLSWSQGIYGMTTHREDVNTRNAIHNGLMRRHLNGRAFLNDPDVFLLRDYKISHSWAQRKLLAQLIKLTAGVLFISDDVSRYNEEQRKQFDYMLQETNIKIQSVDLKGKIYTILYEELGVNKRLVFSLKDGRVIEPHDFV